MFKVFSLPSKYFKGYACTPYLPWFQACGVSFKYVVKSPLLYYRHMMKIWEREGLASCQEESQDGVFHAELISRRPKAKPRMKWLDESAQSQFVTVANPIREFNCRCF